MTYMCRIPSPPLNSYIDDFYYLEGPAPHSRLKTFPMPSLHLMVNFGQAFCVYTADQTQLPIICTQSWIVGMFSTYHIVEWPSYVQFFGIHFKPGGIAPFLQLPLSELHNQIVALDTIWGPTATEMRERLFEVPTIQAGFDLLEQLLLARLFHVSCSWDIVQYALEEFTQRHGRLSIRQFSEQISISQNHLNTQFKQIIGISPKEFARLLRFFYVLRSIDPTQPVDWTFIAHDAGFYDQSHFNKEFSALTGYNPTSYLQARRQPLTQNLQPYQSLGQLPTD